MDDSIFYNGKTQKRKKETREIDTVKKLCKNTCSAAYVNLLTPSLLYLSIYSLYALSADCRRLFALYCFTFLCMRPLCFCLLSHLVLHEVVYCLLSTPVYCLFRLFLHKIAHLHLHYSLSTAHYKYTVCCLLQSIVHILLHFADYCPRPCTVYCLLEVKCPLSIYGAPSTVHRTLATALSTVQLHDTYVYCFALFGTTVSLNVPPCFTWRSAHCLLKYTVYCFALFRVSGCLPSIVRRVH